MRTISIVLILSLLWSTTYGYCGPAREEKVITLSQLKQRYPAARLVEVSPAEFGRIRAGLDGNVLVLAELEPGRPGEAPAADGTNATSTTTATTAVADADDGSATNAVYRPHPPPPPHRPPPPGPHVYVEPESCNVFFDLAHCGSADDWGLVIYVAVGVVVVAALVVYGGVYLANVLVGAADYEYWWDVEAHSAWLVGGPEDGALFGVKMATGFVERDVQVGLAAEVGYLDLDAEFGGPEETMQLTGVYGLVGPAIRWVVGPHENPAYVSVELLAGTSEHNETRLLSVAKAGVNWGMGDHLRFGLTVGSLYVDLKASEGLIQEHSDFNVLLGAEVGTRF